MVAALLADAVRMLVVIGIVAEVARVVIVDDTVNVLMVVVEVVVVVVVAAMVVVFVLALEDVLEDVLVRVVGEGGSVVMDVADGHVVGHANLTSSKPLHCSGVAMLQLNPYAESRSSF